MFSPYELSMIRDLHEVHGPRVAYAWYNHHKDIFNTVDIDTTLVEEFIIKFYLQYNQEIEQVF